ncbi:4-(cytidine 5'-diphospho)-2-C-methyl-D-erythritol kinase [Hoeflea sp. YIM 152468]|uniref:4-(cytidine 5'-diphospho)-2-C-methyl-D-erythritol kinase n=1 Tax=Hoeflea sp. YIM 152468 TaxID=3031759 RepID=UPI0023D99CDC|nr:4-(cytidine 5'-diphospho)-2-C-methyl-D-erythritol kinase [Hoeflea sp. YIM 152468]MDF1606624.1 4-(cytidine 5'-diphospho)-2-C-methyl-D-erythritol kinase [Hoeflea sp. YIM 152468]
MRATDAPAKINLALHVTGQRADGYHLIESFVVFTELGDRVMADLSSADGFHLEGPESAALSRDADGSNLVVRARDALREAARQSGRDAPPVSIRLDKRVPVASGIGGGSADAAATLKALSQLWDYRPTDEILSGIALDLGADVPMCLNGTPLIARGIGEVLQPVELGFALDLVLVNPRIGVSTPEVFSRLGRRHNPPLPAPKGMTDRDQFIDWLAKTRNDLEAPARNLVADISQCLSLLEESGARLARMSGSGATCFGLYACRDAAAEAAARLKHGRPDWFIAATCTVA